MIDTLTDLIPAGNIATAAHMAAARNWAANLRALLATQPRLADEIDILPSDVEWVFGRDGSLTAIEDGNHWWCGCSLPARAAEFMLRKAQTPGSVVCFLYPLHAAQLRVALDRMQRGQALLALAPKDRTMRIMLACDDFAKEIASHRLYFASGEQWETELDRLLEENIGLPTPTQFIRPILADASPADALVEPAQKIFAEHGTRRAERAKAARESWQSTGLRRICLVAPSQFRLWDDTGATLTAVFSQESIGEESAGDRRSMQSPASSPLYSGERERSDTPFQNYTGARGPDCRNPDPAGKTVSILRFDSDDPASASPAALAEAAAACDAIVTPNTARGDLPNLVPGGMPWATWVTAPRIPSFEKAGPHDTLLLADADWKKLALERGWTADRIFIAGWPQSLSESQAPDGTFIYGGSEVVEQTFLSASSSRVRGIPAPASELEWFGGTGMSPTRHSKQTRMSAPPFHQPPQSNVTPHAPDGTGVFRVPSNPFVAIIADTRPLDPPESVLEYSSHRLLWEAVTQDLLNDPFLLKDPADRFLTERMRRARIEDEGLDRPAFVDGIILHAFQQGIARLLIREGIPLRLFGSGWDDLDAFSAYTAGRASSREELVRAVRLSAGLIHAWPTSHAHPIEAMGKPVIRAYRGRGGFVRDVRNVLAKRSVPARAVNEALTRDIVVRAVIVRG